MQLERASIGLQSLSLASSTSWSDGLEVERTRAGFLACRKTFLLLLEAELQVAWIEGLWATKDDCISGAVQEFGKQLLQQLTQASAGSHWSGLLWVGWGGGGYYLCSQDTMEYSILL